MKDVLLIHEVTEEILNLPLEDYVLTFDDGLYSFWYYYPIIKRLNTEKYLFITTNMAWNAAVPRPQYPAKPAENIDITCYEAMADWESKDHKHNYISISEVEKVRGQPTAAKFWPTIIGGHGHNHLNFKKIWEEEGIMAFINAFSEDTLSMMEFFHTWWNFYPKYYSIPFNAEPEVFRGLLCDYGIHTVFGGERIDVEQILERKRNSSVEHISR